MHKIIAGLAATVVLFTAYGAVALEWKNVSREKSKIIAFGDPLGLTYQHSSQADSGNYEKAYDYQYWKGDRRWLKLQTVRWTTSYGSWAMIWDWEDQLANWKFLKDKAAQWGAESSINNPLGKLEYRYFLLDTHYCFFVKQLFGAAPAGRPNIILVGYYCQKGKIKRALPKLMLSMIGYRGEGAPETPTEQLARSPVTAEPTVAATNVKRFELQIAFSWEGYQDLMLGRMYAEQEGKKGTFKVPLPNEAGDCQGTWQWISGQYGTDILPYGTWAIACANGLAASGTYKSTEAIKGTGIGTDAKGRKVNMTYQQ
jgi:hypothetical protein